MKKMYRVFVSSTYEDLKEERIAVMRTLVSMGCLPVGMEYFEAADESTTQYIEKQIDTCDFYLLIVAGRYGTTIECEKEISYTEHEYDYAARHNIPIFAFIHSSIETLPFGKVQYGKLKELNTFKNKVSEKNIARWRDIPSLVDTVRSSMYAAMETYDHLGYVFDNRTDISIPLTQNFSNREVADRILASRKTYIFGLGCTYLIRTLEDRLMNDPKLECPDLKILLMQTGDSAEKIARKRAGWNEQEKKDFYTQTDEIIQKLQGNNAIQRKAPVTKDKQDSKEQKTDPPTSCLIELRHIETLPPYNMFIFDPDEEKLGEIIVHIAGWKTPSDNGRPALHLYKSNNAFWFKYFLDQFNRMWNFAEGQKE